MTKEPKMIDGVDVSECEFFSSGLGYCTIGLLANDGTHICECEPNCYFKQLKRKEQEYNRLSNLITSTKTYEITCSDCRDAILTAPTISGRTKFSQIEVEESSLKKIIEQLKQKEQECESLKRYLNEIRYEELSQLDIDLDEYETSARQEDYSNIITLVERALGEIDV